ncbi:helix-turn-helix domain-containing protein [Rhodovulum marinum]|uniref:DNA-binding XRE family transcriptional regulator n=1 Tax=Rhodovulum marinum TaxID=320662 RepID=A0A4R2PRU7_9RHOB|nr:helix-turn-helix transcriptional regulator [Rhodovulum marinum]TCP38622.1 DNA-binding XRE family transcriptional regulator [Rhodovulum marinum]
MTAEIESNFLADIGRRVRALRADQDLTLEQLARLTGISAPALSLIETGKRDARLTTLAKIAAALRVPIRALLEDQTNDASTGGDAPAEGYDLGDYL